MTHFNPEDYWFEVACKLESKKPHRPKKMLSLNSKGPLWSWACTMPNCGEELKTLSQQTFDPPICLGGLPWSFKTHG